MRAIVTTEFKGQGDHDTTERYFAVGEVIYGALAARAVDEGNAEADGPGAAPAKPKGKAKG